MIIRSYVLLNIFKYVENSDFSTLDNDKAIETPATNKKKGKTKSASVAPFHAARRKGANTCSQLPGSFTTIIRAIVKPLKKSKEINLGFIF